MFKFRFAILVAGAALAFGTASVLAMESAANHDNHGATVSSAARTTCRASAVRGQCVSAIASTEGQENSSSDSQDNGSARAKAVAACKQDNGDDATEKAPAKGDKAAKTADQSEDRTEHQAIVACITGKTPSGASTGS